MDDPRGFVDFQTVLWDVDDRTCTIFMGTLILFYDRIVDMEEKMDKIDISGSVWLMLS